MPVATRLKSLRDACCHARRQASVLVPVVLTACSPVPTVTTPKILTAPVFTSSTDSTISAVAPGGQWWTHFNSSELNRLEKLGLGTNFNLQAAISRVDEAQATAKIEGAARYPGLSVGALYTKQDNYSTTRKAGVFGQATYETDFWGKNRARYRSAQALATASRYDAETIRMTLGASIAITYFQILSLDERIHLAQTIADDAQRVLDLVQIQARLGASSNLNVEQQRNAMQTFRAAVPLLRQQREQAFFALAVLVGEAPEAFHLENCPLATAVVPVPEPGIPASLLRRRPDVQAAEARILSAHFDIGAARAALLPDITLTPLAGIDTLTGNGLWSLVGTLTQSLFTDGALRGQLVFSQARARELAFTYREIVFEALQDVETQLSAVKELALADSTATAAVDSAREAAKLSQVQLRVGSIDFQTLLSVERSLYQAEDASLQVKLQRLQASVGLFRALGGDFDTPMSDTEDGQHSSSDFGALHERS